MFTNPLSYVTFACLVLLPISIITGWVSTQFEYVKHEYNDWNSTYEYKRISTMRWLSYWTMCVVSLGCCLGWVVMSSIGVVKLIN